MGQSARIGMTAAEFAEPPEADQPMELIHGEVIVSPTPTDCHQGVVGALYALLRGCAN
ncbi:MAG: hypothetical protein ACUVSX_13785 [Aggregatilineales bacterium]